MTALSESERAELKSLIAGGKAAVRRVKRAQILLAADAEQNDESIAT
ncbi:MAG: IS630 family transposase, partial [Myxococcaceae bacterium]